MFGVDQIGRRQFVCTTDLIKWTKLPELATDEIQELERLGFGIASRVPFFGKVDKKLPKEETDADKQEESKEEEADKPEDGEGDGENKEAKEKQPKPVKPKQFKLLESHRLSLVVRNIYQMTQIVVMEAFTKQHGQ